MWCLLGVKSSGVLEEGVVYTREVEDTNSRKGGFKKRVGILRLDLVRIRVRQIHHRVSML